MGVSVLGIASGSAIFGLSQLNSFATANRLYTTAHTLAQNEDKWLAMSAEYEEGIAE